MTAEISSSTLQFADLKLSAPIAKAIQEIGYETPSPIQAQTIPHLLAGQDILGVAQTGTGKTAAFALPLLSNLDTHKKTPQILCLTPTRELAIQVAEAFQKYARHLKNFRILPVYGGADPRSQTQQLKHGVQVVIGTPGRTMDHMRRGNLILDDLKALVLDEADEMLSMGFQEDVEWILQHIPQEHQTALFSATMPAPIQKLTSQYLRDPVQITVKAQTQTAASIQQRFIKIHPSDKMEVLTRLMEVEDFDAMLVFVRTRNATQELAEKLSARGYQVEALSGDIAQTQREKTVQRLKKRQIDILIATDVAARGLDVDRITHVINYDIPYDPESYVHRIGRTGRAGRTGDAILLVTGRQLSMLKSIEKVTRSSIKPYQFPHIDELNERKTNRLFAQIDSMLQQDLKEYMSVVEKYLKRNDTDPIQLAAALACIQGGGEQEFYLKDAPQLPERSRKRSSSESSSAPRRRGQFSFKKNFEQENRPPRHRGKPAKTKSRSSASKKRPR